MYGWQTGNAKVLSLLSVAYLVRGRGISPQGDEKIGTKARIRREGGCGEQDDCEEALIRHSLLAFFFFSRLRKNYCATMETQ